LVTNRRASSVGRLATCLQVMTQRRSSYNAAKPILKLSEDPHRRLNALTNEWMLVSPHRATRPWQGEVAHLQTTKEPSYDPSCYLCPGNTRAGGIQNPAYSSIFVFENDFAALRPQVSPGRLDVEGK